MATAKADAKVKPQVNPLKKVQEDIIAFLQQHQGKAFSSYEIAVGLQERGTPYAIEHVQDAMGYLADAGQVKFSEQRYMLPRSN
jgi:hypothetical protein